MHELKTNTCFFFLEFPECLYYRTMAEVNEITVKSVTSCCAETTELLPSRQTTSPFAFKVVFLCSGFVFIRGFDPSVLLFARQCGCYIAALGLRKSVSLII